MAGSQLWPAQEAMYTILNADGTLATLLTGSARVFDGAPPNQDFPYACFGPMREVPDDTFARNFKKANATVWVFSRYAGNKEAARAVDRVAALLDGGALSITGYNRIRCTHVRSEVVILADSVGLYRRGEAEFEIRAEQV